LEENSGWENLKMSKNEFRVVVLTAFDRNWTCDTVLGLAHLPNIKIVGILLDQEPKPLLRRLRNLRYNIKREGFIYLYFRTLHFVNNFLDKISESIIDKKACWGLLRSAFPEQPSTLADLSTRYNIPLHEVPNLNGPQAIKLLRELNADLGVVLGTRILKRSVFSIPRLGCINLHKGKVPEYRGMPPGFWELYESQNVAGVTVHFIDDGLDTGDIIGEAEVGIHEADTMLTLEKKLDMCGGKLLASCVSALANGKATSRKQSISNSKPKTSPTWHQRSQLDKKLGLPSRERKILKNIGKTIVYLTVYYGGLFQFVRFLRTKMRCGRTCAILYHRVNDLTEDALTANLHRFAEHMVTLKRYYSVTTSLELTRKIHSGERLTDHSVVIHFDDCYRDVYSNAAPILAYFEFPACCFVSSGYLDTDRVFPHDDHTCPFSLEQLRSNELKALIQLNFEIGAHTVNHVDLGKCDYQTAEFEILESRRQLEAIVGRHITLFSYPFGKSNNINSQSASIVQTAGYTAMFSAYGGHITNRSDLFNLPRIGATSNHRPIDLIMEIEGLSFSALKGRLSSMMNHIRMGKVSNG
jgi:peptidoglycan/xylan/chitin deacetylase (PgdA/CDA1 family)/folate-dependent phosphoribosylglycinamide formyltransferase PurN